MASSDAYPIPPPTVFFMRPGHLEDVVASIAKEASRSFILYPFARRHKQASISEGYLTKESLWDRLLFDSARAKVLGEGAVMRAVIISGGERIIPGIETIIHQVGFS
jgi:long-chain acyl-CoA synthetase